jgi:ribonuclease HII
MQIQHANLPSHLEGKLHIIGADEVGYGSLAGPLVVCGVKAPKDWSMPGLNDSKKLSAKKREALLLPLMKLVQKKEILYHLVERSNEYIDKVGVAIALKESYVEIFKQFYCPDSLIISDGTLKFDNMGVDGYDMVSLIKADGLVPAVMAASIIAKTWRDDKMHALHYKYPNYGWDHNVGYGAKDHMDAIAKYGPCELHRFSYAPMKHMRVVNPKQLSLGFKEKHEE